MIALLLTAGVYGVFNGGVQAQEKPQGEVLDLLFQLGLPDTRGAKWVKAQMMGPSMEMNVAGVRLSGNAWLIREEKDGTVELVTGHATRMVYRRMNSGNGSGKDDGLPQVMIQPADLDRDIKAIRQALTSDPGKKQEKPVSDDEEDVAEDEETSAEMALAEFGLREHLEQGRSGATGGGILFLAHLQKQGRGELAQELLPLMIKRAPEPAVAVDSAVSAIGNGRLSALTNEWITNGNREAYEAGIERLTNELTRGWAARSAALLLLQRVREMKPAATVPAAGELDAAAFLLSLNRHQVRELPVDRVWLLPGSRGGGRYGRMFGFPQVSDDDADDGSEGGGDGTEKPDKAAESSSGSPDAKADPVKVFFAHKGKALMALARVVDDHRLLRVTQSDVSGGSYSSFSYSSSDSDEEKEKRAYNALPRPMEVGELAWKLIQRILPSSTRFRIEAASERAPAVVERCADIAEMGEEDLAWNFMRNASGTYDVEFRLGLSYLVKHGSDETVVKLREVFLDPAVWQRGSVDSILPLLEPYLKRLGGGGEAFVGEVKKVVADSANEESDSPVQIPGLSGRGRDAAAASLKKLDQLLKPSSLKEILADLEETDPATAGEMMGTIMQAVQKAPQQEASAQLLQAMAKTAKDHVKNQLVMVLMQLTFRPTTKGMPASATAAPQQKYDEPTQSAILKLLEDDTPYGIGSQGQTISLMIANTVTWPQMQAGERDEWTALGKKAPYLVMEWIKTRARAVAKGEQLPPTPNGKHVPDETAKKLVDDLAQVEPGKVLERFRGTSPDEQLAVIAHLAKVEEWPESLRKAQRLMVRVSGNAVAKLSADQWKGRFLDEKLEGDITAAVELSARDGKAIEVEMKVGGPLSGLTVDVRENTQTMPPEMLKRMSIPGLANRPAPLAMMYRMVGMGPDQQVMPAYYGFPVWKEPKIGDAWRTETVKGTPPKNEEQPFGEQKIVVEPATFLKKRGEYLDSKAPGKPFVLSWSAILLKDQESLDR